MKRPFLWLLAFVGAADCVVVPILFAVSIQQAFFPLPGLYFLEIALLGLLALISTVREQPISPHWLEYVPWITAGVLLTFNLLGGLTIGFYLIPGTLSFLAAGIILSDKIGKKIWQGLGLFFVTAITQAVLMLALIGIL
jgi:hypothetical protein